ncbi:MAG: AtpZ/AtpI family protein [Deltaproteobacteria bacterium]|nr:AtpZ/AtpI family protein [Deltaproteobacteria bacterium]
MAAAIAIGYFGGRGLDGAFGTAPVLQWVGLGLGIAAAGLAIVRVTRRYLRDAERDEQRERDERKHGGDGPV